MNRYKNSVKKFIFILISFLIVFTAASPKICSAKESAKKAYDLFNAKKYSEAVKVLKKIPSYELDESLKLLEVDAYIILKEYDKAESLCRKYLKQSPNDLKIRFKLAEVLSWTQRYEESAAQYAKILAARPSDIQIKRKLAFLLSWSGEFGNAIEQLKTSLLPGARKKSAIVDKYSAISDIEAEIMLGKLYLWTKDYDAAISIFEKMSKKYPGNIDADLNLARAYFWGKKCDCAIELYEKLVKLKPEAEIYAELADAYLYSKNLSKALENYKTAFYKNPCREDIKKKYAFALNWNGDYGKAFPLLEELYAKTPSDTDTAIELALNYAKSRNTEKAVSILEPFLKSTPDNLKLIEELAWMETELGHAEKVRELYIKAMSITKDREATELYFADLMNLWGDFYKIEKIYESYLKNNPDDFEINMKLAGVLASEERREEAREIYNKLLLKNINDEKVHTALARLEMLKKPAEAREEAGQIDRALKCYEEALRQDPSYFPARIGMAVGLAVKQRYEESLKILNNLLAEFPQTSKLLMWKARVLAWSKKYNDSISAYDELIKLNPYDPVAPREAARAAAWGNMYELSDKYYDAAMKAQNLPALQRSISLEKQAKKSFRDKKFIQSEKLNEELVILSPGNEEAVFDLAQNQYILGLKDESKKTYEKLLNIDPMHAMAWQAVDKISAQEKIGAEARYSYWNETGYGDLAQIKRRKTDILFDIPLPDRYGLRVMKNLWEETPHINGAAYGANGYTIEAEKVFNEYAKVAAGVTAKSYDNTAFGVKNTGFLNFYFNLNDSAQILLGYDKRDELYNLFGLRQGTQSKNVNFEINSNINRKFNINGSAKFINYSDANSGKQYFLRAGYEFTDFPKILNLTYTEEWRDTAIVSLYTYNGPNLANITYPYWTPQNYTAGTISLIWHHDISKQFFGGNDNRYYDIKIALGNDSNNNPARRLESGFYYELDKKWTLGVKGLIHKSPQWDASGLWGEAKCRF